MGRQEKLGLFLFLVQDQEREEERETMEESWGG